MYLQNFCRIYTHYACTFTPILSEGVSRRWRISTLFLHTRERTWPKLPPVLSTALQKQSDPKITMLYGVPLGSPALSLLGQRCQGSKLQRQKCEDKGAKVRRCEVEVWRLYTTKAKVQNYEGWYYYHSFAYKICLLIFALCHSIFALLLSHLHSFAFALHRIRRWNLDRTDG